MPVVPFSAAAGGSKPKQPDVDDPWLLMAAAQMDAQGRLLAKDEETEEDTKANG